MKTLFFACLTAATSSGLMAFTDFSGFNDAKIEMPPLTLSEIRPEGNLMIQPTVITTAPMSSKMISNMPVVTRGDITDYKIIIRKPDTDIGYALITKQVDMTPAK